MGEEQDITLELELYDATVNLGIEVDDIDSSILDGAVAAANAGAARAEAAADRAEAAAAVSEDDHLTAAADHTIAAADHDTAHTDHLSAMTASGRAFLDHQTAVADHGIAQSDHETAAADHETAAADHAAVVPATARAEAAAAAAEHMVDIKQGPEGPHGVGFDSVSSEQDGTVVITLTSGDTITIDINHAHPQYPKYVFCENQAAYDAITVKEDDTFYVIPQTS